MAENHYSRWSDTDDAVVTMFYPAEAAKMLGRSLKSIYARRSLKNLGRQARDRKPRQRLRREYFQRDSQGAREEAVEPRPKVVAKCRFCPGKEFSRGLCCRCIAQANWLIRMGYVPLWVAEQRWFAVSKYAARE